jgi:hypothetical protein
MSEALPAAVAAFCAAHGVLPPLAAQPLRTGRNSEVQRLQHAGGLALLKRYFQHPADRRDRLGTEFAFLSVCQQQGLAHVPRALAMDRDLNCALYSFLPGQRPELPTDGHIAQAARFILALNGLRGSAEAAALPLASDACLSIEAHLGLASSRIARLMAVAPDSEVAADACAFVRDTLEPAWRALDAAARAAFASGELAAELPQSARILSPSDFGFHNSLEHEGVLAFVDFEYAGWDDPAKLICDFQCQPELPVTPRQGASFRDALLGGLGDDGAVARRVALLLPLHRIKWCGILLNELRSEDRQRRLHAGVDANALLETQLAKARRYFQTHLATIA